MRSRGGLALLCLTLGLVVAGVWANIVGYSSTLFSADQSTINHTFNRDAYLLGRLFVGLVFIALARSIPRVHTTLATSVALIMSAGTGFLILSSHQSLFDPEVLAIFCVFATGGGYTFMVAQFYVFFAEKIRTDQAVFCITLSLVLELICSVLISLYCTASIQALIVIFAPLVGTSLFLLGKKCHKSSPHIERQGVQPQKEPLRKQGAEKVIDATQIVFLVSVVIYAIIRILIRGFSSMGIWGSDHDNYLGIRELVPLDLFVISVLVILLMYLVFILPRKRLALQVRCVIAFAVLLIGLQLLAMVNDYQLSPFFDSATTAIALFAHLAYWMMVIACITKY